MEKEEANNHDEKKQPENQEEKKEVQSENVKQAKETKTENQKSQAKKQQKSELELREEQLLLRALENSEILIAYVAENGLDASGEHMQTIVEAKNWQKEKSWNAEKETKFWKAYRDITKSIKPVTIKSLRAAQERPLARPNWFQKFCRLRLRPSQAKQAVRRHTIFALLAMAIMLIIQIYSLKGTTLLNTIKTNSEEVKQIEKNIQELGLITERNMENRNAVMEKSRQETLLEEKTKEIDSSIELLAKWLELSRMFFKSRPEVTHEVIADESPPEAPFLSPAKTNNIDENIMVIQEAKNLVLILGLYILPLLYGLLGGFAFVLRSLAAETQGLVFTKGSNIKYALRIHLGALAGLAVGLFWGDIEKQQIGFIESLSPLAIAFVAGYSVEFLFRIMDRIISNVSLKTKDENENNKKVRTSMETG